MKKPNVFMGLGLCLALTACTAQRLDPTVIEATATYYPQTIDVTTSEAFVEDLGGLRGGTPEELAAAFSNDVQTGLSKDLPRLMKGQRPALIKIQFTDMSTGPAMFQSPTSKVVGHVSIVDAASGITVAQTTVTADNSDMAAETNRNPLGALVGTAILYAVVDTPNLMLRNLAGVFRREVKKSLGNKSIF